MEGGGDSNECTSSGSGSVLMGTWAWCRLTPHPLVTAVTPRDVCERLSTSRLPGVACKHSPSEKLRPHSSAVSHFSMFGTAFKQKSAP